LRRIEFRSAGLLESELSVKSRQIIIKRIQGATARVIDRMNYGMSTGTFASAIVKDVLVFRLQRRQNALRDTVPRLSTERGNFPIIGWIFAGIECWNALGPYPKRPAVAKPR
jgi:hypothetical protein